MTFENFSLKTVKNLSETASQQDVKNYITKFFLPLSNGKHALHNNGIYEIFEKKVIKETYFDRMDKKVSDYYFKENLEVKSITYKLNKPTFYDEYLNLCPKMKHEYIPYKDFSDDIKGKVNIVLKFIKEIWCSGNNESYAFCEKWLSNMIKGNKNNSCLYLKCHFQGMGKSTIPIFIRDHVIGDKLCLETGSEPIKSKFNSILAGKLMVVLEELENFSIGEWQSVSTCLKRIITSKTINIQSKGVDAYETENINNYILISNNDAIKDDDGRRYFVLDLSTEFLGRDDYFDNIYNKCFNDEVGRAFFCYMMEVNTDAFNPQKYPITQNKKDSIAKALDNTYKFLKNNFILCKKGINCTVEKLFDEYKDFCQSEAFKPLGKINFCKKMKEIGINFYQSNGGRENKYKVQEKTLLEIANKHKWIHELDCWKESNEIKKNEKVDDKDYDGLDFGLEEKVDYKTKYEDILKQFEEYKKQQTEVKEIKQKKKKEIKVYYSESEDDDEEKIEEVKMERKKIVFRVKNDIEEVKIKKEPIITICSKCKNKFDHELQGANNLCVDCYQICTECYGECDYVLNTSICKTCYDLSEEINDSDIEDELDEDNEKQLDELADVLLKD